MQLKNGNRKIALAASSVKWIRLRHIFKAPQNANFNTYLFAAFVLKMLKQK